MCHSYLNIDILYYIVLLNSIKYDKLARKYDSFYGNISDVPLKYGTTKTKDNTYDKYKNGIFKTEKAEKYLQNVTNNTSSYCHKCGNKLLEDSIYCNKCGTKIN